MRTARATIILLLWMAIWTLASCDRRIVFDHYEHTPIVGWEKNDTLSFNVRPMAVAGVYRQELGLRITGQYPFRSLRLVVRQEIWPEGRIAHDTIDCQLINERGTATGQGIAFYQYNMPVSDIRLREGDSLHICIGHDMKREILPGISDVGLKITMR